MTPTSSLEPLEARIAPAAVFTFTEPDGDVVAVKTSRGMDPDLAPLLTFDTPAGATKTLQRLDLSSQPGIFETTNISIAVVQRGPAGDGLARVGEIKAVGLDLGKVMVKGDLGALDCGNAGRIGPAAKSLTADTMGRHGAATLAAMGDLTSTIAGSLGKLTVVGSIMNVSIVVQGAGSTLGVAKIGGSMIASNVSVEGSIASFTVGTDIRGSALTGLIRSVAGDIGTVRVGGDVSGGGSAPTGGVLAEGGSVKSVTIGGNVFGGTGSSGGGLNGGVLATGRIGSVMIGGDIYVDSSFAGGNGNFVTGIRAGQDIGTVKIRGDAVGAGFEKLEITAFKSIKPGVTLAIKSVTIGGTASAVDISAGYALAGASSADVQIGSVSVGGDWIFGSIRAGIASAGSNVGNGGDTLIAGGSDAIISRIASIAIKGSIYGAPFHTTGFVAEDIRSLSIGGGKLALQPFGGTKDRFVLANSGSVRIYEV